MGELGTLGIVLLIAAAAGAIGIEFGIFILAPRLTRLLDRTDRDDEEPGDRAD
jgi:hypothetical protein